MPRCLASVWLLLTVFTVGGVVAPTLHRTQHGLDRLTVAETPCHPVSVHEAEEPQMTGEETSLNAFDCTLCTVRLLVVPSAPQGRSTPTVATTASAGAKPHLTAARVFADHTIRGPPALS